MTLREFHNGVRILLNLDRDVLERAGVIKHGDYKAWDTFRRDPFHWFIKASDDEAERLWALMQQQREESP